MKRKQVFRPWTAWPLRTTGDTDSDLNKQFKQRFGATQTRSYFTNNRRTTAKTPDAQTRGASINHVSHLRKETHKMDDYLRKQAAEGKL